MPIIDFKATMCKHCYKCVRGCEVKSIMIRDGHAYIMPNRCILCGQCLLNSPQSLGLLALACSELTHRWPDEFSSILKQAPDEYRREAAALLKNIPGAYETGEL